MNREPLAGTPERRFNCHSASRRDLAMAWDDLDPKPKKPPPVDLALMSIEDLKLRIEEFETEIERMRQSIKAKEAQRNSADALFKKG
jgi:uncharacterized small protein (DUF1192 family)